MRIKIFHHIVIFLFVLIALDLFYLQIIRGGYFARLSQNNATRLVSFDGPRGRIFDRNGKVMAESIKAFEVALMPQDIKDKTGVFSFLSGVLGVETEDLRKRYSRNKLTPFSPVVVAGEISREQAIKIEENAMLYPGLLVSERYTRRYPYGSVGAHVIGYVGKRDPGRSENQSDYGFAAPQTAGVSGVEIFYDEDLRGQSGGREIEVNSRGQQVRLLSERDPVPGKDLVLSIDQNIQLAAQDALAGRRGAVVIIDPSNGEVLAMVSAPSFDPNIFASSERRNRAAVYLNDPMSPLINRAIFAHFPPGSVFKIIVAMAGLEEKKFEPSMIVDCPGYYQLGDRRFNFPHAYGAQDLKQAMTHSANEYFFRIGLLLGPEQMAHYARVFGLGDKTGIDMPYELKGRIPGNNLKRSWYKGDTVNMAIGQGDVLTTPVQIVRMIATVENEGWMPKLRVLKSVNGKDTQSYRSRVSFRKPVWDVVKESLLGVVNNETGTASELRINGLVTYGKTGTAQVTGKEDHAWFAGVTKGRKKTIAYCLLLEHGGSSKNAVAAVREILMRLVELNVL